MNPFIVNIPEEATHILFKFPVPDARWEHERFYFNDSESALKAVTETLKHPDSSQHVELLNLKTRQLYIFSK